jgi:hypothetical protein
LISLPCRERRSSRCQVYSSKNLKSRSKALSGIAMSLCFVSSLVNVEETAVEVWDLADQGVEFLRSLIRLGAEALVEQTEQELAVEGPELVLALGGLELAQAVTEVVMVAVEQALLLDEVAEHQAVEHDRGVPVPVGNALDAIDELVECLVLCLEPLEELLRDPLDIERCGSS